MARVTGSGPRLYERARARIPGGTQVLSKRPEMFLPGAWPSYYARAKGVEVWDLDGNRFVDMSTNGVGVNVLGYADEDVNAAVKEALDRGHVSTLNCPEEVELAETLCRLHPWADMVRFCRGGGEATAMAVRIARAKTGRDKVAFCGYHGWTDWYLAANLGGDALQGHLLPGLDPAGVPRGLRGTALPFRYNRPDELESILSANRGEIAAVITEPIRGEAPRPGFLEAVRDRAHEEGAVFIFDEVTAAWRANTGGYHRLFGVDPDLAAFSKAMGNGHPIAAVAGRREVMEAAQATFISSTNWTERVGPAAALATIRKHERMGVPRHLARVGNLVKSGWQKAASAAGLEIQVGGIDPLANFRFVCDEPDAARTLFTKAMLEEGFLAGGACYASFAHTERHVEAYLAAVEMAFRRIADGLSRKDLASALGGPTAHSGFRRLA
ncbi:MAG: aminotransferase class III-fold pyridoxal phosphate-dependent enzyme [Methanobacteriota archaeon]